MPKQHRLILACHGCEQIGPALRAGASLSLVAGPGRPRATSAISRTAWLTFITDHAGHDLRLLPDTFDPMIPLEGWMPRPEHGPASCDGRRERQIVACPDCHAVYRNGDPTRRAVAYLTADEGTKWFLFCRQCRNVWGEAANDRMLRAELGRSPIEEALWLLQRQGIQLDRLGEDPVDTRP